MITRYFQLQLNAGSALPPVINVNQYDSGESWVFTLYQEDGTVYQPSSGSIVGVKADGNAIANAGTVNADGQVVITETQQMTAVAGKVDCELTIDSGTHGTLNFTLQVEADPVDGAVVSDSDLSLISEGIQAAEDARTALETIAPTNTGTEGQFLMRNSTTSEWADIGSDYVVFDDTETLTTKMEAVESDITTNADNISTNTENISTNAENISTNTENISTNADNISTNATAISTLATALGVGQIVSTNGGSMSSLVSHGQMWLVVGTRATVAASYVGIVHRYNDTMYVADVIKPTNYGVVTNEYGTVAVQYNSTSDNVYQGAIRIK